VLKGPKRTRQIEETKRWEMQNIPSER